MFTYSFNTAAVRTLIRFDDDRIKRLMNKAEQRNLWQAAKFTRTTMQRLIRKRKKPSKPYRPPHSHVGTLRRLIFYAWDPAERVQVVGPFAHAGTGRRQRRSIPIDRRTGAEVLEKGGRVIRMVPRYQKKAKRRGRKVNAAQARRIREEYARRGQHTEFVRRIISVKPRPYASVALKRTMPRFPQLWSNSIRVA